MLLFFEGLQRQRVVSEGILNVTEVCLVGDQLLSAGSVIEELST